MASSSIKNESFDKGTIFRIIKKGFRKISKYTIFKQEHLLLELTLKKYKRELGSDLEIRLANDNRESFLQDVRIYFPEKYDLFKKRLNRGLYIFGIYSVNGPLAGYTSFATEDYYEPYCRYTFKLARHQIYQFDGYMSPNIRKGRNAVKLLLIMLNYFIDKGYTHSIAGVDRAEERNLTFHAFLGFKETGEKVVSYYIFRRPFSHLEKYSDPILKQRKGT